jgi:hydroxyacyl-ACP dehydratase HTD2-like protein with hotdog domain
VTQEQRCLESVTVDETTELTRGPLTTAHLMRWSGATENWHKIHYDQKFTLEHEKLPGLLINGSLKQQFLLQMLKAWAGPGGRVWKMSFQFRGMNVVGETLTCWGKVQGMRKEKAYGLVDLEIGIRNEKGVESTPGTAVIALPYQDGQPLPYPFHPESAS